MQDNWHSHAWIWKPLTHVWHVALAMRVRECTSDMYYVLKLVITMTHAINSNTKLLSIDITRMRILRWERVEEERQSEKKKRSGWKKIE